jgi:hypothetical protein
MHPMQYLRRRQAAEYLRGKYGVGAPATLAKLATVGGGPVFQRIGRIPVYTRENLDAWATAKLGPPLRSTTEATKPNPSHYDELGGV